MDILRHLQDLRNIRAGYLPDFFVVDQDVEKFYQTVCDLGSRTLSQLQGVFTDSQVIANAASLSNIDLPKAYRCAATIWLLHAQASRDAIARALWSTESAIRFSLEIGTPGGYRRSDYSVIHDHVATLRQGLHRNTSDVASNLARCAWLISKCGTCFDSEEEWVQGHANTIRSTTRPVEVSAFLISEAGGHYKQIDMPIVSLSEAECLIHSTQDRADNEEILLGDMVSAQDWDNGPWVYKLSTQRLAQLSGVRATIELVDAWRERACYFNDQSLFPTLISRLSLSAAESLISLGDRVKSGIAAAGVILE